MLCIGDKGGGRLEGAAGRGRWYSFLDGSRGS